MMGKIVSIFFVIFSIFAIFSVWMEWMAISFWSAAKTALILHFPPILFYGIDCFGSINVNWVIRIIAPLVYLVVVFSGIDKIASLDWKIAAGGVLMYAPLPILFMLDKLKVCR